MRYRFLSAARLANRTAGSFQYRFLSDALMAAELSSYFGLLAARFCYGNLGPPKILVLGTKFSRKISPGGPILPENFDPCPKILVLPAPARSLHVSNQGVVHSQLRTIWYRYDCAYILSHLCLSTCTMYVNKLQSGTEMFTNMLQNEATF